MAATEVTFKPDDGKRLPCRPGEERTEYHEPGSGLRLRVTGGGARTWSVTFWSPVAKIPRRRRLGDAALMPVSKARAAARDAIHPVEQEGRDPYGDRLTQRAQERDAREHRAEERRAATADRGRRSVTFGRLAKDYVEYRRTTPS